MNCSPLVGLRNQLPTSGEQFRKPRGLVRQCREAKFFTGLKIFLGDLPWNSALEHDWPVRKTLGQSDVRGVEELHS